MVKFKPGIPDSFTLDVEPVRDLGDYLDEPRPMPVVSKRLKVDADPVPEPPVEAPPQPPVAVAPPNPTPVTVVPVTPAVLEPTPPVPPLLSTAPAPQFSQPVAPPVVPAILMTPANSVPPRDEPEREERGGKAKAPRREISMTPETLRMSDELLEVVRSGSGQRDTKANELFHALVLLVYEVIDDIDTHTIPKRGRWGTPTARAYPLELKNAFLKALLDKYGEREDGVGGLKFPVNTAA